MRIGKLTLSVLLSATPAVAYAQVGVDVRVNADLGDDSYDTTAPGAPVESVDVFYDQLSPYGVWVDEPDAGRVFIPTENSYVPYTNGHWQYTSLGFVWVSNEPFGWATGHYGRWAYSNSYNRWVWAPDTQWGPAWVEWRQTGSDFGWAPLAPEGFVRVGYQAPIQSWHYCGSDHVLDVNVTRYYEPRDRVVVIQREARPIEHYSNVSNVRVVVGPPPSVLREHRITVRPVKVEARAIGRYTPEEAHTQVVRAQEHKATFEVQNEHRIDANAQIHAAHTKVIETHPQIKAQVDARVSVGAHPEAHAAPARPEPAHAAPAHPEPAHAAPARPEPHPAEHAQPAHPAPAYPQNEHAAPQHPAAAQHEQPKTPPAQHREPEHAAPAPHPAPAQHEQPPAQHREPEHAAPAPHAEPSHAQPAQRAEPAHPAAKPEPKREEPKRDDKGDEHH